MSTIWTISEALALEVREQYLLLILCHESFHELDTLSIAVSNQPSITKSSIVSIHSDQLCSAVRILILGCLEHFTFVWSADDVFLTPTLLA